VTRFLAPNLNFIVGMECQRAAERFGNDLKGSLYGEINIQKLCDRRACVVPNTRTRVVSQALRSLAAAYATN
jgi:hypothetical protein